MGQCLQCLLPKHKSLNLSPQHSYKKPGLIACTCHPSTREMGAKESLRTAGQPA